MDFLESHYCRITKILLSLFGQWPYELPTKRLIITIVAGTISFMGVLPKMIRLVYIWGDLDLMIDWVPLFLLDLVDFIKLANNIINFKQIHKLFDLIQNDWKLTRETEELEVMKKYAKEGEQFIKYYILFMSVTGVLSCCMPIIPILLDVVLPLNESRPAVYMFQGEYFVDQEKFYYLILFHAYVSIAVGVTLMLAIDTEYATHVYHSCAIFGVVRYRLQHIGIGKGCIQRKVNDEMTYHLIADCVKQHESAMNYFKLLESSRTSSMFFVIGTNIAALSITGVQTVIKLDQPTEAVRFGMYTFAQLLHIFYNCYPAQKLFDASDEINDAIYSSNWENTALNSRQLLIVMMIRSQKPCQLTAGKIFVMSLMSFATVVKTSMSYLTVLLSFQ